MTTAVEQTQEAQTEQPTEQQVPDGQMLHTLSEDDDDEGDEQGLDTLDKRGRRSWARQIKQDHEALKQNYETEKQRNDRLERELAELRGRVQATPTYVAPRQQEQPDPVKQRMGEVRQQMQNISRLLSSKDTPQQDFDRLTQEYYNLDEERIGLAARAQMPRQSQQPQMSYEETVMRAEFPEMFPDQGGRMDIYHEVNAEFLRLKNGGKPHALGTMKEAADNVFKRSGIRQKAPAPSNADKAKLSGTPGRAGASGQGGREVPITKRDVSDALAYFNGATGKYAQWSEKQKVDYWLKNVKLKGA